jgi:hypothetical protein
MLASSKIFPHREGLVSDITAGDGNVANLFFYSVCKSILKTFCKKDFKARP